MTEEQKQALTGLCKIEIKRWKAFSESNPNMRYMAELMEIALVALTVPPVKLPNKEHAPAGCDTRQMAILLTHNAAVDRCAEAIRAAGYQVEGE